MRTTLRIDDALLRRVKRVAAETGQTLTAIVEDALREALARRARTSEAPTKLTTVSGEGLAPGLSLDDTGQLLDAMDSRDLG